MITTSRQDAAAALSPTELAVLGAIDATGQGNGRLHDVAEQDVVEFLREESEVVR